MYSRVNYLIMLFVVSLRAWVLSGFSRVWLFATQWTVAHQAPLSLEFSRQEYWRELPFLTPEDLPSPGIEPSTLVSPVLAGGSLTTVPPGKPQTIYLSVIRWKQSWYGKKGHLVLLRKDTAIVAWLCFFFFKAHRLLGEILRCWPTDLKQ